MRHRAPYQVIRGRLDELVCMLMGIRPVDLFPDEALVHIHHGDEAINATPDGRVVPSKSNYIREHLSVATKHVYLDRSSPRFKPALMTPHTAPHLRRRGKVSSSRCIQKIARESAI